MKNVTVFLLLLLASEQVMFAADKDKDDSFTTEKMLSLIRKDKEKIEKLKKEILDEFALTKDSVQDGGGKRQRKFEKIDLYNKFYKLSQETIKTSTEKEKPYIGSAYANAYQELEYKLFPSKIEDHLKFLLGAAIGKTFFDSKHREIYTKGLEGQKSYTTVLDAMTKL